MEKGERRRAVGIEGEGDESDVKLKEREGRKEMKGREEPRGSWNDPNHIPEAPNFQTLRLSAVNIFQGLVRRLSDFAAHVVETLQLFL